MKTVVITKGWRVPVIMLLLGLTALTGLQAKAQSNDALPTVTIESAKALEGRVLVFVARLDKRNDTNQSIGFSWRTEGITATPDVDYEDNSYTTSFFPGERTSEIVLITIEDDIEEGSETFKLIASEPEGVKLGNTEAIGTITEPKPESDLPEVAIFSNDESIEEGGVASFTLNASPRPATSLRVTIEISQTGSFAASGQTGRRTVTIDSRGRGDFTVATTDDSRNEATGEILATVVPGQDYEADTPRYHSAATEVTDNDLPALSIRGGSKISEGGTAKFTLSASPRPAAPIVVNVNVTQNGEFAADGELGARTVTIGTNGRGQIEVETSSDTTDEDDGSISASLGSGQGYSVGSPASAHVDVSDGGVPTPRISIRAQSSSITEGGTATFELTANPRPTSPLDVRVDVTDSGSFARSGEIGTRTLTIGTNGKTSFDVETVNDLNAESDGRLSAEVLSGAGYLVASSDSASVTVRDESIQVTIRSAGSIVEGETATFTLIADPAPPESLNVNVNITQSGDFLTGGAYSDTVTIDTDGRASISIDTLYDGTAENDGSVSVTVESGYGYAPGSPARATARVSDSTPTVTISAGTSIIEGDTAIFTLTADPAPEAPLNVRLDVSESTGGNFTSEYETGEKTVLIYTDGTGTVEVRTDDDATDENPGDIRVRVLDDDAGGYYRIGSPASASLRVNDNDNSRGQIAVSVADAEVVEGAGNGQYDRTELQFAVTLNRAAAADVEVSFELRSFEEQGLTSAATPGSDYRDNVALWARFDAGETEQVFSIVVYDDDEYEELPETFELVVSSVFGARVADGVARGTILPDPTDAPRGTPVVTITGGLPVNEGATVTFKLTAKPAPEEDLVVDVTVYDDSIGSPESDYLAEGDEGLRQVTIPGTNKQEFLAFGDSVATLSLRTIDDSVEEASGQVRVVLQSDVEGRYDANQEPWQAVVDVRDNDGTPPAVASAISVADARAQESDGAIFFDVTANPPVPLGRGPVTVRYQILSWAGYGYPGAAQRDVDFKSQHGTLIFHGGESFKQVEIEIIDDDHDEGEESFALYISHPTGGATIADASGRGTIVNTDPLPAAFLGRFGRGLAEQAVSGITARLKAGRTPGFDGRLLGHNLSGSHSASTRTHNGQQRALSQDRAPAFAGNGLGTGTGGSGLSDVSMGSMGMHGAGMTMRSGNDPLSAPTRTLTLAEALAGSAFTYTREADEAGGSFGLWGRGMHATFNGSEGTLNVDGTLTTGLIGADYARADWQAGLAVLLTGGKGRFKGETGHGTLDTSMTAFVPYAAKQAGRLSLWGAAGVGLGEMTLSETLTETHSTASLNTDMGWQMAAGGVRSDVGIFFGETGPDLALVGDAQWTRTTSEKTRGLRASEAQTTRLRVGVEGGWSLAFAEQSLRPTLEAGVRYDAGDAETGLGVDVGAALSWAHTRWGLAVDVEGRTLVLHEAKRFTHSGFAASLTFDPDLTSLLGPSLTLTHRLGGPSNGGMDALFAETLPGSGGNGSGGGQWQAEAAYGMALFRGRFIGAPTLGYTLSGQSNDYRLGWRLTPAGVNSLPVSAEVGAMRREVVGAEADHGVTFNLRSQW